MLQDLEFISSVAAFAVHHDGYSFLLLQKALVEDPRLLVDIDDDSLVHVLDALEIWRQVAGDTAELT
jgi:hypothetical protein